MARGSPVEPELRPTRSREEYIEIARDLCAFADCVQPLLYAQMMKYDTRKNVPYLDERIQDAEKAPWNPLKVIYLSVMKTMKRDAENGKQDNRFVAEESTSLAEGLARWWCEGLDDAPEGRLDEHLLPEQMPQQEREKRMKCLNSLVSYYCTISPEDALGCLREKVMELSKDRSLDLPYEIRITQENQILCYQGREK